MPNYPYTFQLPPLNVQDIPNDGVAGEFLGINGSGVLDWLPAGGGDMLKAENLSGLANYATARTNIGLGTASTPTFANLTLTSPSLSSSAPVTISQTWNNAAVAFTGLKVNAAGTSGTNSASGSLLLDLQLNTASQFSVRKDGFTLISGTGLGVSNIYTTGGGQVASTIAGGINVVSTLSLSGNTFLVNDGAANTLALRNGAAAQTFNVYGTSSSSNTVYSRLAIACDTSGNATLTTQSTGTAGTVSINGVPVGLGKGNVSSNVAVGTSALNNVSTGSQNIAIGYESSIILATGNSNVSIGFRALRANTGSQNVAIGADSMQVNSIGTRNTALGFDALNSNSTGGSNTGIGSESLRGNTTGSNNIALGVSAGRFITGSLGNALSDNSVYLGTLTKAAASGETNQIVIGYDATGIGSNSVVLGNDSITKTALKGNVGIGTTAPASGLHVAGVLGGNVTTFDSAAALKLSNTTDGSSWLLTAGVIGVANSTFCIRNGGSSLSGLSITNGGNVGIGINAPTSKLHVAGNSSPTILIENTLATGYSQFLFKNTAVTGDGFWLNGSAQSGYGGPSSFNLFASSGPMAFHTASVTNALSIAQNGAATFSQTATFGNDINGQRDVYCASNRYLRIGSSMGISSSASGVLTFAALNPPDSVARLTFGGIDATFPAIKRSTVRIQAVLANDSGFTNIQGKLTTDTDYTATVVTPTGFLTLYDAQGTAYRVPCVLAP